MRILLKIVYYLKKPKIDPVKEVEKGKKISVLKKLGYTIAGTGSIRVGTCVGIWVGHSSANMSA